MARLAGAAMLCAAVIPFKWRSSLIGKAYVFVSGAVLFGSIVYLVHVDLERSAGPDYGAAIVRILSLAMFAVIAIVPGRFNRSATHVDG